MENESPNGLLRGYIPKGTLIEPFSDDDVLMIADELNDRLRRIPGCKTSTDLFVSFQTRFTLFDV